ncbi:MAG: hypothetical protein V7638_3873 [Acidobacteriota bacterium]|jgi:hypothetical protein
MKYKIPGAGIHLERIAPNKQPGGLWFRQCTLRRLLSEHGASIPSFVSAIAEMQGDEARAALADGETVWLYIYDGDTGDCVKTLITKPR